MQKCLIVVNGFYINENVQYKIERLREEFASLDVQVDVKDSITLLTKTDGNQLFLDVQDYDFCIDMDKDHYLAKALSMLLPMFDGYEGLTTSDDKMESILALYQSGIQSIKTITAPLCYVPPKEEDIKRFLDQVENEFGYPMVCKDCHGSLGKQVFLIHDREELEKHYRQNYEKEHLYEQFLKKHQGHDYRLMVISGEVVACMERINENDFRSNIALGGKGKDVTNTISQDIKDMAIKVCEVLKLDYAGIDIGLDDNDSPVFIEANGNAFFTEIEKVCHINVARKFALMAVNKISKQK